MDILVTGHKGYIGAVLVPLLSAAGHRVTGLDSDLYRYSTYGTPPVAPWREIIRDVRDIEPDDLAGIDAVVHLAALSNDVLGEIDADLTYAINHQASVRLAEMARKRGIERFVFASSCSLYGAAGGDEALDETAEFRPVTAYARSKVRVEQDVAPMADDGFSPVFLRNATAYGMSPRIRFDVVVNNLTAWAYTTGEVMMKSDGSPWRPLVHVLDISRAVLGVLEAPRQVIHNRAFNIGTNRENYRVREVADIVQVALPDCVIGYAPGASADIRDYRVDFSRFAQALPEYQPQWRVTDGVAELLGAYRRFGLGRDDFEGPGYKRIAQLQQRLATGDIGPDLRWQAPAERSVAGGLGSH
jgi:nucleoside-diphosphate-sugar epimerase